MRSTSQHTTTSWNETESLCENRDSVELSVEPFLKLGAGTAQLVERSTVNSESMLTSPPCEKGIFSPPSAFSSDSLTVYVQSHEYG